MLIKTILIIIGAIIFAWCFLPQFFTGNRNLGAFTGGAVGLLLLLYGIFFSGVNSFICRLFKHAAGKVVVIICGLIIASIVAMAGCCIVSMVSACSGNKLASANKDEDLTVIVLGCHVYPSGPSRTLIARLDAAKEYLNDHPGSMCIVCGGNGGDEPCTEAEAMYDYLVGKGVSADRIIMEDKSLDTVENLTNALALIEEYNLNPHTAISTSNYHMYRAVTTASRLGIENARAIPSDTLWWILPSLAIREMYGILEMWFLK